MSSQQMVIAIPHKTNRLPPKVNGTKIAVLWAISSASVWLPIDGLAKWVAGVVSSRWSLSLRLAGLFESARNGPNRSGP